MKRKIALLVAAILLAVTLMPAFAVSAEESGGMDVSAPAAVLMDYTTGKVLYEKNGHEQRPCASITKVMTLVLVFEQIEAGNLTMEEELTASAHASSMGGSDIWLTDGERMTVDDLLKATVVMSANDAAVVLAEAVSGSEDAFVAKMNEKANALGMADTTFKNCNGLDEDGHVTSAYNVALMSRELMKYDKIYEYTTVWIDYLRGGATQLVNTNKLIRTYNGITGLKTGTTSKAGSCISATASREGLSLVSVILGAANTDDRFKDAATLLDYGFANWSMVTPEVPQIPEANVNGGMQNMVKAEAPAAPELLMDSAQKGTVESRVLMNEELKAPIIKGDVIGKVEYYSGEELLASVDIKASEDVEEITFLSSLLYLLNGLLCP